MSGSGWGEALLRGSHSVSKSLGETGHFITHLSLIAQEKTLLCFGCTGRRATQVLLWLLSPGLCKGTLVGTNFLLRKFKKPRDGDCGEHPHPGPQSPGDRPGIGDTRALSLLPALCGEVTIKTF